MAVVPRSLTDTWTIGDVAIPSRIVLAPMAGVSVQAFRRQGRRFGAGLVCSEMVSASGIQHENRRTLGYLRVARDERPLAIDAKFPLEAITAYREAQTEEARRPALARLKQDINKHVNDISERYLVPGETQDIALMFVPSESVYADLHEVCDDVLQKAFRARVILVSPSLLMLAIQVVQAIVRDAQMRDAAEKIQVEVGKLVEDVGRLRDRAVKLQTHFAQASEDVGQVLISAEKVSKRGGRIQSLELEEDAPAVKDAGKGAPTLQLKLGGRD